MTALHFFSLTSRWAFPRGRRALHGDGPPSGREPGGAGSKEGPHAQELPRWHRLEGIPVNASEPPGLSLALAGSLRGAGGVGCAPGRRALLGPAYKRVSGVCANYQDQTATRNQSPCPFWGSWGNMGASPICAVLDLKLQITSARGMFGGTKPSCP